MQVIIRSTNLVRRTAKLTANARNILANSSSIAASIHGWRFLVLNSRCSNTFDNDFAMRKLQNGIPPFQGYGFVASIRTQGVALGFRIAPLQGIKAPRPNPHNKQPAELVATSALDFVKPANLGAICRS